MFEPQITLTGWLPKLLCHPESCLTTFSKIFDFEKNVRFSAGSSHRNITPLPEKITNITSTAHTAKRHVRGGFATCKVAFTLAEVLITLGIIGVVAAMTIPTLLQNRVNTEVESKLKKVYSVMNQAILMSEQDNGPKEYWPSACGAGQNITCEEYYNKYILKYLKGISYKTFYLNTDFNIVIFFTDGSALIGKNIYDYFFYPNARNFELNSFGEYADNGMLYRNELGRTFFSFRFLPGENIPSEKFHFKRGFEPYKHGLEEFTFNSVKNGSYACTESVPVPAYCTALIQLNGWKIPKDYPFKVR